MEAVLKGSTSTQQRFEIGDPSQVSFARRGIGDLSVSLGFDETVSGRLAIIVTECATNQLKYAQRGELLVRSLREVVPPGVERVAREGIELLAIDSGPGIADLHASFVDGYTTAGSSGNGLGAIQRLADELDVWSAPGLGTALRAVVWGHGAAPFSTTGDAGSTARASGTIEFGAINLPLQGEFVCGDAWSCCYEDDGFLVMVADGLGHGPLANTAAVAATDAFGRLGPSTVEQIVTASHDALRGTRGAAVGVARIPLATEHAARAVARFCGIGNIAASVWSPVSHKHLVSHAGIVGHQMHKAQAFEVEWPADALLILHSDGLATRWDLSRYPGLALRHPSLIAATLYRDFARGRDDITVFVARARDAERR
ncbi:ATP-binding SpoIIE family protein phosphatase [Paraburkholderia sp. PREW-6R]|uniref:ATP-binding SpoIIE family protein phosphatase n=1 Tax=Paraburkholderia sp. PREW-6R TaxID=3141544 RepID=UPI0031F5373E